MNYGPTDTMKSLAHLASFLELTCMLYQTEGKKHTFMFQRDDQTVKLTVSEAGLEITDEAN